MVSLLDILSGVPKRREIGTLDTSVVKALNRLESEEVKWRLPTKGRIDSYLAGLPEFLAGVDDGYNIRSAESDLIAYNKGHVEGVGLRTMVKYYNEEGGNSDGANSYERAYKQLRSVSSLLIEEFGALREAKDNPYKFLVSRIPKGVGQDAAISEGLVKILTSYKDLVEDFLRGTLDGNATKQIASKASLHFEDYVKLGLIHLLNGEVDLAQRQFFEASIKYPLHKDFNPVRDVAHNIHKADTILSLAYTRIQLANQFESGGKQLSQ